MMECWESFKWDCEGGLSNYKKEKEGAKILLLSRCFMTVAQILHVDIDLAFEYITALGKKEDPLECQRILIKADRLENEEGDKE